MALSFAELTRPIGGVASWVETADGTRLHTLAAGAGRAVVFAHGYGANHEEWNVIARALLERGRRVVLFDQRGHGKSTVGRDGITSAAMASDYRALLEHHDVREGVLVGHSMGGFLSIRFMLAYPELAAKRLSHALIMASFAGNIFQGSAQNRLQIPLMRSGLLPRLTAIPAIARAFTRSLAGEGYTDAMADAFMSVFRTTNHGQLWPILKAFGDENYYPELPKLKLPCTIFVGERDKTSPPFHTRDMARLIPGAQLVTIPGAGHLLNWEAAEPLVERLTALTA